MQLAYKMSKSLFEEKNYQKSLELSDHTFDSNNSPPPHSHETQANDPQSESNPTAFPHFESKSQGTLQLVCLRGEHFLSQLDNNLELELQHFDPRRQVWTIQ